MYRRGTVLSPSNRATLRLGCTSELKSHGNTRRSTIAGTTGKMARESRAAYQVFVAGRRQLLESPAVVRASAAHALDYRPGPAKDAGLARPSGATRQNR